MANQIKKGVRPYVRRDEETAELRLSASEQRESGNSVAWLYRDYRSELVERLRRIFGAGPPEPEDLAQEAFAKFASMTRYHDAEHPKALVYRMALNIGFNASKRISVARRYIEAALREADAEPLEEMSPEDVYTSRERLTSLVKATAKLSDKQREILARSRIQGETYAEISEATGWSSSDISRQLQSAMVILLSELDDGDERDVS